MDPHESTELSRATGLFKVTEGRLFKASAAQRKLVTRSCAPERDPESWSTARAPGSSSHAPLETTSWVSCDLRLITPLLSASLYAYRPLY